MPSVSIDEAWGENDLLKPSTPLEINHESCHESCGNDSVSARKVHIQQEKENVEDVNSQKQNMSIMLTHFKDALNKHEEVIYELRSIRHEENRRCTMYLTVTGVLFAMLFMYIDRLQQQIRVINSFMIQRQAPTMVGLQGFGV